jgi:hypothetical protein
MVAGLDGALFVSTGVRNTWSSSSLEESSASETIPSSVSSFNERWNWSEEFVDSSINVDTDAFDKRERDSWIIAKKKI